jgi:hypothetical protein
MDQSSDFGFIHNATNLHRGPRCIDAKVHRHANFSTIKGDLLYQEINYVNVLDRKLPFGNNAAHTCSVARMVDEFFTKCQFQVTAKNGT